MHARGRFQTVLCQWWAGSYDTLCLFCPLFPVLNASRGNKYLTILPVAAGLTNLEPISKFSVTLLLFWCFKFFSVFHQKVP